LVGTKVFFDIWDCKLYYNGQVGKLGRGKLITNADNLV
jgi:hypothetical protein